MNYRMYRGAYNNVNDHRHHIGVVINTGIHNIEILILDNSEAQDTDKAQIEVNKDYKMIMIMRQM